MYCVNCQSKVKTINEDGENGEVGVFCSVCNDLIAINRPFQSPLFCQNRTFIDEE